MAMNFPRPTWSPRLTPGSDEADFERPSIAQGLFREIETRDHGAENIGQRSHKPLPHTFRSGQKHVRLYNGLSRTPNEKMPKATLTTRIARFFRRCRNMYREVGWRGGIKICIATTATIAVINFIFTTWALATKKLDDGFLHIYQGSCAETASMGLWISLTINVFGILLLGASNYTMQIISSPTRREVDLAHNEHKWLDVGISSIRNFWVISRRRKFMWMVLGLCSIPLHVLYNSAVFASKASQTYGYYIVTEDFSMPTAKYQLRDSFDEDGTPAYTDGQNIKPIDLDVLGAYLDIMREKASNGTLVRFEPAACMTQYATEPTNFTRNVLLVSTYKTHENSLLGLQSCGLLYTKKSTHPPPWICGEANDSNCTLSKAIKSAANWSMHYNKTNEDPNVIHNGINDYPISYCLAEPAVQNCKLTLSLAIMIVVITANLIKAIIMSLAYFTLDAPTLVTVGDAIASFLARPDRNTTGLCISSSADFRWRNIKNKKSRSLGCHRMKAKKWVPKPRFWFKAVSVELWVVTTVIFTSLLIGGIIVFAYAFGHRNQWLTPLTFRQLRALYHEGMGDSDTALHNILSTAGCSSTSPACLIKTTLLVNLPQLLLSYVYLTYNTLFSCLLAAHEWALFAHKRLPLRVTWPKGKQRSTYWLQLPYSYAIPLLALSSLLHWLLSQSLYLLRVDYVMPNGQLDPDRSFTSPGYSLIGIFFSLIAGGVITIAPILTGFRRYSGGIPLVGNCSAAISAACHPPPDDKNAAESILQWGVVNADDNSQGVKHCCFTSFDVTPPVEGKYYAGLNTGGKEK